MTGPLDLRFQTPRSIEGNNNRNMMTGHRYSGYRSVVRDGAGTFTGGWSSSLPPNSHQDWNRGQIISGLDSQGRKTTVGSSPSLLVRRLLELTLSLHNRSMTDTKPRVEVETVS